MLSMALPCSTKTFPRASHLSSPYLSPSGSKSHVITTLCSPLPLNRLFMVKLETSKSFASNWSLECTRKPLPRSPQSRRGHLPVFMMLPTANPERASQEKPVKWSARAIKSFSMAELEARKMKYPKTGTEALLMGILAEGTSPASKYLRANGVTLFKVRNETVKLLGKSYPLYTSPEHPTLTEPAQKALDWAVDEKIKSGESGNVTTTHMLLGIWAQKGYAGQQILANLGFDDKNAEELAESVSTKLSFLLGKTFSTISDKGRSCVEFKLKVFSTLAISLSCHKLQDELCMDISRLCLHSLKLMTFQHMVANPKQTDCKIHSTCNMFTWGGYASFYDCDEMQQSFHISGYNPDYRVARLIVDKIHQMCLLWNLQ